MIGNDLERHSLWPQREPKRRDRFRARVYSRREQAWLLVQQDENAAELVLWCAKEATHKAAHRLNFSPHFRPRKIGIWPDPGSRLELGGFVAYAGGQRFRGRWWRAGDRQQAIAWWPATADPLPGIRLILNPPKGKEHPTRKDRQGRPWIWRSRRWRPLSRSNRAGDTAELRFIV